jgi:prolyl-tRNA synthetase
MTVEGFIPATGRGIQGGTSHCLGQHFSKMFNIIVEDPVKGEGGKANHIHVWQNSWGFTTRSIGVMVLTHGDNKGLITPPRVAKIQCVIVLVGITAKTSDEDRQKLEDQGHAIVEVLKEQGVRVHIDMREGYSPPWKFNDWELKGVPLRIEFGPKDAEKHVVTCARRDNGSKTTVPITGLGTEIPNLLETIQSDLFKRADEEFRAHRKLITKWDDFVPALNAKNVCLIPHCETGPCEDQIKDMSKRTDEGDSVAEDARAPAMGAKSLCIPLEQPEGIVKGETKCTNPKCGKDAVSWVMFGRSY